MNIVRRMFLFNYEGDFKVIKCPEFFSLESLDNLQKEFATGMWDFGVAVPTIKANGPTVRLREGVWLTYKSAASRIPNFQEYLDKAEALEFLF